MKIERQLESDFGDPPNRLSNEEQNEKFRNDEYIRREIFWEKKNCKIGTRHTLLQTANVSHDVDVAQRKADCSVRCLQLARENKFKKKKKKGKTTTTTRRKTQSTLTPLRLPYSQSRRPALNERKFVNCSKKGDRRRRRQRRRILGYFGGIKIRGNICA